MSESEHRAHHDMGGIPRFMCISIDQDIHALDDFDRAVDAIRGILGARAIMSVDELRAGVEAIPEVDYHAMTYYQRWLRSIVTTLIGGGIITQAELEAALP